MKVLVTGANGQLGKCLKDVTHLFPDTQFLFMGRENFGLEQFEMVRTVLESVRPDWVINAAAYTAVDKAEVEATLAFLINGESVGHLASVCAANGIRLLNVSTDYVFDGTKTSPYVETDVTNPMGVYGASKLQGENLCLHYAPDSIVVRTSWVYSQHGHNFVKTMLRLMGERDSINVVNDQHGNPTYAIDLATALLQIIHLPNAAGGIYHFSNSGPITWYQLARAIKELTGSQCQINPITTDQYPTPAKRPAWSVLSNEKIQQTFEIAQQDWHVSLQQCLKALGH
jgi:dTDP-4-dehydrorhamnose reductase